MDDPQRDQEAGNPPQIMPPQGSRNPIPSILLLVLVFFVLMNHNGDEFLAHYRYQDAIQTLTDQLSNYTAWLSGAESNFTLPEREAALTPLLDTFNIRPDVVDPLHSSYYVNITGFIHADVEFFNISEPALLEGDSTSLQWRSIAESLIGGSNMTDVLQRTGSWNWTACKKLQLSVVEKRPTAAQADGRPRLIDTGEYVSTLEEDVAFLHGKIEITDEHTSEDLRMDFEGVHFRTDGSIYGIAEPSGRQTDIRLLPALLPQSVRNETAHLIEPEISARITKLKNLVDAGVMEPDNKNDEPPKSACPFTFFGQLHALDVPERLMLDFESEMQKPTGVWTIPAPKLSMNAILVSKECGILYKLTNAEGLRSKTFFRKVTTYAGFAALSYLLVLVLFSRQAERSQTPSGVSRVSRWTFLSQATVDSVSFAGHITFAILAEGRPSLSLIAPAFLACMLFTSEAQFAVLIHQVQLPEDIVPPPPLPPVAAAVPPPSIRGLPLPGGAGATGPGTPSDNNNRAVPPPPPPTPAAATGPATQSFPAFFWHHIRTDPQARLWILLFVFLTCIVRVILSPMLSMLFVASAYSCMWLPQIGRSAMRGRASGLSAEYVVGVTVGRLGLVLYFLACPKNVLEVEPKPWALFLSAFVILQAVVLLLQEHIGPDFFVPSRYVAEKPYNYHPPLPLPIPHRRQRSEKTDENDLLASRGKEGEEGRRGIRGEAREEVGDEDGDGDDDEMDIDIESAAAEMSLGDCAICMDAITLPAAAAVAKGGKKQQQQQQIKRKSGGRHGRSASTASSSSTSSLLEGSSLLGGGRGSSSWLTSGMAGQRLSGLWRRVKRRRGGGAGGDDGGSGGGGGADGRSSGWGDIGDGARGGRLAGWEKSYSLAPCHHLFHTACLERWLAIKNICPQCRRPLPPL